MQITNVSTNMDSRSGKRAIRCKDGVILGNDTRSTWGYAINGKNVTKVFPLTKDKRIAMTCYGLIGDFQALARIKVEGLPSDP